MKKSVVTLSLGGYLLAASICHHTGQAHHSVPSHTFSIASGPKAGSYNCPDQPAGIEKTLSAIGVNAKEVKLIRPDDQGRNVEFKLNLDKIRRHESPDLLIKPGDTIYPQHGKGFKVLNFFTFGILGKIKK